MEGGHHGDAAVGVPGSAGPGDRDVAPEQQARGGFAERDDHARSHGVDLAVEEGSAAGHFVGVGRSVPGRPTLHDVANVDAAARDSQALLDHLGEQLAGAAHEGQAAPVLGLARSLTDEHQPGLRGAVAEYDLRAPLAEATPRALAETLADLRERRPLPRRAGLRPGASWGRLRRLRVGGGRQRRAARGRRRPPRPAPRAGSRGCSSARASAASAPSIPASASRRRLGCPPARLRFAR
jgi:hypothetical protein